MLANFRKKRQTFYDQLRIYNLNITIMATMFLIFVLLGATSYLYMQPPSRITHKQELEAYFRQENAKREWKQLHKYHGYPSVVIYEEGKTPYFYDKQGNKCTFIYPAKARGVIVQRTEDSKYYASLTLNKESMIK